MEETPNVESTLEAVAAIKARLAGGSKRLPGGVSEAQASKLEKFASAVVEALDDTAKSSTITPEILSDLEADARQILAVLDDAGNAKGRQEALRAAKEAFAVHAAALASASSNKPLQATCYAFLNPSTKEQDGAGESVVHQTNTWRAQLAGRTSFTATSLPDEDLNLKGLGAALCESPVSTLRLVGLGVTDSGVAAIGAAIAANPGPLEYLDLSYNDFTDGVQALLPNDAGKRVPKLRTLRLAGNRITASGLEALGRLADTLEVLDLRGAKLQNVASLADELPRLLKSLPKLRELILDDVLLAEQQPDEEAVVQALLWAALRHQALFHLSLVRTGITDAGAHVIARVVAESSGVRVPLRRLDVRGNRIGALACDVLLNASAGGNKKRAPKPAPLPAPTPAPPPPPTPFVTQQQQRRPGLLGRVIGGLLGGGNKGGANPAPPSGAAPPPAAAPPAPAPPPVERQQSRGKRSNQAVEILTPLPWTHWAAMWQARWKAAGEDSFTHRITAKQRRTLHQLEIESPEAAAPVVVAAADELCGMAAALALDTLLRTVTLESVAMQGGPMEAVPRALGAALAVNTTLRTLNLAGCDLGEAGVVALATGLGSGSPTGSSSGLEELNLEDVGLGDAGTRALASALGATKLRRLVLRRNMIGDNGARALGKSGLAGNATLQELDLSDNAIGDSGAGALLKRQPSALRELHLARNRIRTNGAKAIAEQLLVQTPSTKKGTTAPPPPPPPPVEILDLSRNGVGTEGARALTAIIRHTKIRELRLADNALRDNGIRAIVQQLQAGGVNSGNNRAARDLLLDLSGNNITPDGTQALAATLSGTGSGVNIRSLLLRRNDIKDDGADALGEALAAAGGACTVTFLDVTDNDIGGRGARALGASLTANTTLLELRMANNHAGHEGASALGEGLSHNKTVLMLDIADNGLGDVGTRTLAKLTFDNEKLRGTPASRELRVGDKFMTDGGRAELKATYGTKLMWAPRKIE